MEIKNLNLHLLTNDYHFEYVNEFKQSTAGKKTDLKIKDDFDRFLSVYAKEDEAIQKLKKSNYSEEKQVADKSRDALFSGVVNTVEGALNHFDPAIQAAAKRIRLVLDESGNLSELGIKQQSSATATFIAKLRKEDVVKDVAMIGLTPWLDELEKRNENVRALEDKQNLEASEKTTLRMKEVRKEMDTVIRAIWRRLEALMLLEGEAPYADYVRQLNERNTKYADILAQKAGARAAKKKAEEGK